MTDSQENQMNKFRVAYGEIEARKVVRETKHRIWFISSWRGKDSERSENKRSTDQNWFDTWEDAHAFLVEKAQQKVENLRLQLERAKGELGQIKGMKKEKTA